MSFSTWLYHSAVALNRYLDCAHDPALRLFYEERLSSFIQYPPTDS